MSEVGAREPTSASRPSAKAMSVAAGIAQPVQGFGRVPVDRREEDRRDGHAADRGDAGQRHVARVLELAFEELAFELEPDEEEEHRHQPVVDPQDQRFREPLTVDGDRELRREHVIVEPGEPGVCDDQREHRRRHQGYTAGGFVFEQSLDRGNHVYPSCFPPIWAMMLAGQ